VLLVFLTNGNSTGGVSHASRGRTTRNKKHAVDAARLLIGFQNFQKQRPT